MQRTCGAPGVRVARLFGLQAQKRLGLSCVVMGQLAVSGRCIRLF